MAFKFALGKNAKLYIAAALFTGADATDVTSADLTVVGNVKDLNINGEKAEADTTTRESGKWRSRAGTLIDGAIEYETQAKSPDETLTKIRNAWLNDTELGFVALTGDKDTEGHEGPAGNFNVMNFSRVEELEDSIRYSVTLVPSSQMQWYVVGGS